MLSEDLLSGACWRSLNESSIVGVVVCDLQGRLLWVNPRVCDWLGLPPGRLEGRAALEFIHPQDRGSCRDSLAELALDSGAEADHELRLLCPEGIRWIRLAGKLMQDARQKLFVVFLFDASDYAEIESELVNNAASPFLDRCARADSCATRQVPHSRSARPATHLLQERSS